MKIYSIQEVESNVMNGKYEVDSKPKYKRYKENHVFDELQSVKWNRDKVIEENNKNIAEHKEYWDKKSQLQEQMKVDVIKAFKNEMYKSVSEKQLEVVYEKVLMDCDCDNYSELFYDIEQLVDFCLEFNQAK